MISRADQYNQTLAFINNPPHDCTIEVIAPDDTFEVGRLTTDKNKLETGYQMGLKAAEESPSKRLKQKSPSKRLGSI